MGIAITCDLQGVVAQPDSRLVGNDEAIEIKLDQLSKPPPPLVALIDKGTVRLVSGGDRQPNSNTLPSGVRLAGETRFTFRYRYDSHARWVTEPRRAGDPRATPMVRLRVRFRSIELLTRHEVWLRQPPPSETFWQNKVVLHEFDHVRISADPRIEDQFREAAKKIESMRVPLADVQGPTGRVDNAKVQALIETRMKQTLQDTTDLVKIRYQELDRLTKHGLIPLPQDAGLFEQP